MGLTFGRNILNFLMKIIPHQEFLNFIFSQPRERKIEMSENFVENDSDCGCMMIHLARNNGLSGMICADFVEVWPGDGGNTLTLEKGIKDYFPYEINGFEISLTYGEVQDYLIKGEKNPLMAENS